MLDGKCEAIPDKSPTTSASNIEFVGKVGSSCILATGTNRTIYRSVSLCYKKSKCLASYAQRQVVPRTVSLQV